MILGSVTAAMFILNRNCNGGDLAARTINHENGIRDLLSLVAATRRSDTTTEAANALASLLFRFIGR